MGSPGALAFRLFCSIGSQGSHHEKNLSAQQNQACTYPWIPGQDENPRWSFGHQRTPRQGTEAPDCLKACPTRNTDFREPVG